LRVTIKSIAKDLEISHMTVSRALSGNPNVNPETRAMILARAKELGYVKSSAANAMRGDPTAIVGLLLPNIINEFYARFANALAILCADLGLDLVIHLTNDDPLREQQSLLRLQSLQAATVILVPAPDPDATAERFPTSMRLIELIRSRQQADVWGQLLIEDGASIAAAVAHLVRIGRQRIAFIGAAPSLSSGRTRVAAFEAALQSQGVKPLPELIKTGAPGFEMGHRSMAELLGLAAPPDALICGGFEISNGALECCLERGVVFPRDLAFVGYGDPISYRWIGQGISTIDVSPDDLAQRAVELLAHDATAPNASPTKFVLRGSALT
jgi:DNA-binding LacI/PurR family transcriptional regulator